MTIGTLEIRRMGKNNPSLHLWLDICWQDRWYVVMWRKGLRPYAYSSQDATPPCSDNAGRWLFGRRVGISD